jgi:nicotinamide-nucleotide amidase
MAGPVVAAQANPTIAFLASGIEGLKVRLTARAADDAAAAVLLDAEQAEIEAILGGLIFSTEDLPMEAEVGKLLLARGQTLAVAESLTGGLLASRVVAVAGASDWFRGGVVSYASDVKHDLLDVPEGPVVSEVAACAMAANVRHRLGADVGLSTTGVAGPTEQDGEPVGTVWIGLALGDEVGAVRIHLPGDRDRVRQFAVISAVDRLRKSLLG